MKSSSGKRKFEILILTIGILMAAIAGLTSMVLQSDDGESSMQIEAILNNQEEQENTNTGGSILRETCQYLKILTIN